MAYHGNASFFSFSHLSWVPKAVQQPLHPGLRQHGQGRGGEEQRARYRQKGRLLIYM
jgi:hypothetical protein